MARNGGEEEDSDIKKHKDIILKALEDLVTVNSLFTMAVFVGISMASPNNNTFETRPECQSDTKKEKSVIVFEIISFGCFIFSSMLAKSLGIYLNMFYSGKVNGSLLKPIRGLVFLVSLLATIAGVALLTWSVIYVVEIKVGNLSCETEEALFAVVSLVVLVGVALLSYLFSMAFAILHCMVF
ncbi:uncharacterized protein LOC110608114 [Manihot esculenta]|uniref:Uncharacterized protein n=1 Tax=Manihot esculenta TaxID=3983 RepID=A0ACB7GP68_MANES|nr:uncharacterized protein LOC110608114 [Manihot esculenta]KAG8642040.1 hypothetical protein MANES_12G060111v8 [Manihot esculenta]